MDDFFINNTVQDIFNNEHDYDYFIKVEFIVHVTTYIIIVISLPLTVVAIFALYSLVRKDHVAPIYVINLLISDLIQLCCMIVEVASTGDLNITEISTSIYLWALLVSVGFMVCISLERYLIIACPLWYRFRRSVKISVVVCVLVWVLAPVHVLGFYFLDYFEVILGIFFFLPLPLFIFFLGGTLKALSASRVSSDEKRRIVGLLVLVLLIYTLLFLPSIIYFLSEGDRDNIMLSGLSYIFVELSPLADLTLYVFMKKGIIDKLLSSVCCCRMDSQQSISMNDDTIHTVSSM